ncbi:MAG: hypothetical protein EOO41_02665, partial [Methanobacteriota archaeon]
MSSPRSTLTLAAWHLLLRSAAVTCTCTLTLRLPTLPPLVAPQQGVLAACLLPRALACLHQHPRQLSRRRLRCHQPMCRCKFRVRFVQQRLPFWLECPSVHAHARVHGLPSSSCAGCSALAFIHPRCPSPPCATCAMQLCDLLTRELGSDAILKVRTSPGFRTGKYDGNFNERAVDEVDLAGVDSEKALTVSLSLDGNSLKEGDELYAQAAMLYTNAWGQRRIRVHNLRVVATE